MGVCILNWNVWIKRHIWTMFYLLALAVILILSIRGLLLARQARAAARAVETLAREGATGEDYQIIIDPGHGGADGGAAGVTGVQEAPINLAVARKLRLVLALCGVDALMTRTDETTLADPEAQTISAKKVTDIKNRVAFINQVPGGLLVSIHQNMYTQSQYSGAQVFWSPTQHSQDLAEYTQTVLRQALNPDNRRMAKQAEAGIYLMNHITCPGVLVECGFLSNPAEEQLLAREDYQTRLAAAIAAALLGWQAGLAAS